MGLFKKIKDFLKGNKGIGSTVSMPLQEGHELKLNEIQNTFNEDDIDTLVEEGVVENVISNKE